MVLEIIGFNDVLTARALAAKVLSASAIEPMGMEYLLLLFNKVVESINLFLKA